MLRLGRKLIVLCVAMSLLVTIGGFPVTQAADNSTKLVLWWPWGGPSNPQTSFDSQYSDFLAKKIGVRVSFSPCQSDAGQAINLYRAGKNFPDILFNGAWLAGAMQWEDEGNTIPLNKYFHNPKYPNLAKIGDSVLDFFKNDKGEIVCVPAGPPVMADLTKPLNKDTIKATQQAYGWFARKDLLKAYGKPLTTMAAIDQFAKFCKTKKALDGTAVEPFGIPRWGTTPSFENFFYNFGGRNGAMVDKNGNPVTMENTKVYYNMMKQLNVWFKNQMISPEVFTDNGDVYAQKLASAKYGMTWTSSWAMVGYNQRINNPNETYVPIPHWKAPGVTKYMANPDGSANPTQMGWGMMVVSSACTNPDAAMKFIDYMTSDEGYISGQAGAPGVGWNWTKKKGVWTLTEFGKKLYAGTNKDWITEAGKYGNFAMYQYSVFGNASVKIDTIVTDPFYTLCLNSWKGYTGSLYGHRASTLDMTPATEAQQTAANSWGAKKAEWVLSLMQAKSATEFDAVYKKGLLDNADLFKTGEAELAKSWKAFKATHKSLTDNPTWYGPVDRVVNY